LLYVRTRNLISFADRRPVRGLAPLGGRQRVEHLLS
jgi:hypothetical protein